MVLDPLTAIGLAGNIVQFVDFSFKIVSKASEIKQSTDGVLTENFDLEIVTKDLLAINARLKDSLQRPGIAIALTQSNADSMTYEKGRWKSLRQALKSVWDRDKIAQIQGRLAGFREELELRILVDMKNDVDILSIQQSERFDKLERIDQAIVNALLNNHTEITEILQVSSDEQFIRINDIISEYSVAIQKHSASEHQQTRSQVSTEIERRDLLKKKEKERCEIADWLSPNNSSTQQYDVFHRREPGTGVWLLNDERFQRWLTGSQHTLLCPGMPGAGKTVIASIVIDHLWNHFRADDGIGVVHLYCSYKRQQEQTCANVVADFLGQLVRQRTSLPKIVKDLYQSHIPKQSRPQLEEVSEALQVVAGSYDRVFFVLDGLDESKTTDGTRQRLLSELLRLRKLGHTTASLLITSRFFPEDIRKSHNHIEIEIRATNTDIEKYTKGQIPRLPSCVSKRPDLQDAIEVAIVGAANGMFLLAQLHMDSLTDKLNPKAIKKALEMLPKGFDALDTAYGEVIKRIESQAKGLVELAKRVLSWITYAKRQLKTAELQHALAVEEGNSELDPENITETEEIVSVCAGLVTIDHESDTIRLAHETTQQYLERILVDWVPHAKTDIAKTCLTYLMFQEFANGVCLDDEAFEVRLQKNAMLDYASRNWGKHAQNSSDEVVKQVALQFLRHDGMVSNTTQVILVDRYRYEGYSQNRTAGFNGIHLTAHLGLEDMLKALLNNSAQIRNFDADAKTTQRRTPLCWAAAAGHTAVVELLAARDDVDADAKDRWGRTPLSQAAKNGHTAVVELLAARDEVDADAKDFWGRTPLSQAAGMGHTAVVELLAARDDVNMDMKDGWRWTPLSRAAKGGHTAVVELLAARDDVNPNVKDEDERTPLLWAAAAGHTAVVKLLVARVNINADAKDKLGRTPLSWAAENGHTAVVELLAARDDVDADAKDKLGRTPLSWAAEYGHTTVVELLAARDDVDVVAKDKWERTPLSRAADEGHTMVVRLLQSLSVAY